MRRAANSTLFLFFHLMWLSLDAKDGFIISSIYIHMAFLVDFVPCFNAGPTQVGRAANSPDMMVPSM